MEDKRKLATIRRIDDIQPIKNADSIEVATVGGWKSVIKKGEFKIGQTVIYCEIDSLLPIRDEFEFLRGSSYIKLEDGTEGFRIKTMKLRKQLSQGLIIPLTHLAKAGHEFGLISVVPSTDIIHIDDFTTYSLKASAPIYNISLKRGLDVSDLLGIIKYEKPIPKNLENKILGYLSNRIKRTSEERIQNLSDDYDKLKKYTYYESEKLDGESFSAFLIDGRFGIGTRELDLIVPEEYSDNLPKHLRYALKHKLKEKVLAFGSSNIVFQGELIGPGIIKNKYDLEELELRLFNVFDIDTHSYFNKEKLGDFCDTIEVEMAPVVSDGIKLPETIDDLLKYVEGKSLLNNKTEREGSVFVAVDSDEYISFKVISNKYLLKGGE